MKIKTASIAVGGMLVISMAQAQAAVVAVCAGGTAASGTAITSDGFVKVGFTPKCSANVVLSGIDNTASYTVKSGSVKGKTLYGGSTDTGSVTSCSTFTSLATNGVTAAAAVCG